MKSGPNRYFLVDAFTRKRFRGNPAAVVITDSPLSDATMQSIAQELNLSETAFLTKVSSKEDRFLLRWFTPTTEIDLCGHATLASAFVLYGEGMVPHAQRILFDTKSGVLEVSKRQDHICMRFPSQKLDPLDDLPPELSSLASEAIMLGRNHWLTVVELPTEEHVANFIPDLTAIKALKTCLCLTAPSNSENRDFVSRMFGPNIGIDEDPVTGAAHCAIGPYWCKKLDKPNVRGEQISNRSGVVHVEWHIGDDYLILAGQAVLVGKGFFVESNYQQ